MIVVAITDFDRASIDEHLAAYRDLPRRYPNGQLSIQVRIPKANAASVEGAARALGVLGLPLLINHHLEVAARLGAGAHLGRRSASIAEARALLGPSAVVSMACHDEADVVRARTEGASIALVSPVFPAPGKGPPLGLPGLAALAKVGGAGLPVLALGGVDETNVASCLRAGASGFAAIRAFLPRLLAALAGRLRCAEVRSSCSSRKA